MTTTTTSTAPTATEARLSFAERYFKRGRYFWINVTLMVTFVIVGFFWLYPFLWVIFSSFKTQRDMFTSGMQLLPEAWEWSNYTRAWTEANFNTYFFNTVIYAAAATAIPAPQGARSERASPRRRRCAGPRWWVRG